jgi:DNA-binding transcriptional ArsR family regulator
VVSLFNAELERSVAFEYGPARRRCLTIPREIAAIPNMTNLKKQQEQRRSTLRPHPARDQIIEIMRSYGEPISPTRLAKVTGSTLGSIAYHVRTLVAAGVVVLAEEGRVRGAVEHFYALAPEEANAALSDPVVTLLGLCNALTIPSDDGDLPRPAVLDDRAREELRTILEHLRPQVQGVVTSTAERLAA